MQKLVLLTVDVFPVFPKIVHRRHGGGQGGTPDFSTRESQGDRQDPLAILTNPNNGFLEPPCYDGSHTTSLAPTIPQKSETRKIGPTTTRDVQHTQKTKVAQLILKNFFVFGKLKRPNAQLTKKQKMCSRKKCTSAAPNNIFRFPRSTTRFGAPNRTRVCANCTELPVLNHVF